MVVYLDTETRSDIDIRKSNVYRYVESPTFSVLMMAYARDDEPVRVETDPDEIKRLFLGWVAAGDKLAAFNAAFDRVVLSRFSGLPSYHEPEYWVDPAVWAAEAGFPRALGNLAKALGTEMKDSAGTALINWFCKPLKDGSYRQPGDHPEKWADFVSYCATDVEAMRAAMKVLPAPTRTEQELWVTSERINDRGLVIDTELAQAGVEALAENTLAGKEKVSQLLGITNPGSVQQLRAGLASTGLVLPNLQAETVEDALARTDLTDVQREALELRQDLAGSASKKFEAALSGVCSDGRIRGAFKFFGASTGRYSGQGPQPHNLPRATIHASTIDVVDLALEDDISVAEAGVLADIRAVDEEVDALVETRRTSPRTLKALVRPMFLGPMTVADYSAIEARVIAWLAGESWALEAFTAGRDIYVETARRMGPEYTRQQGKTACIAEGSLVLTDRGEIPIERVRLADRVWDGIEWVGHEGVVFNGFRDTLTHDQLSATPDHLVWVEGEPGPVPFGLAASRNLRLARSGTGGCPVRVGDGPDRRAPIHQGELASHRGKARVHDIVNAGPRHRFTVNGRLVHNCLGLGFAGGPDALRKVGMSGTDEELLPIVASWRRTNGRIVAFWHELFNAWTNGGRAGRVTVNKGTGTREVVLPSGRSLWYRGVRWERYVVEVPVLDDEGNTIATRREQREGWRYTRPSGGRVRVWVGLGVENCVQAVARDLLANALTELESEGIPVMGHVHDEVLVEGEYDVDRLTEIMCRTPKWAVGLPVAAEGWSGLRYRK